MKTLKIVPYVLGHHFVILPNIQYTNVQSILTCDVITLPDATTYEGLLGGTAFLSSS